MKNVILATLMMLSVSVSQAAFAGDRLVQAYNNSFDNVEFQLVRDGQVLTECYVGANMVCTLVGELLPDHRNEVVVRSQRGDVIVAAEVSSSVREVTLTPQHILLINDRNR